MNWQILPLPTRGPLFEGAIRVYGDAFAEPPYSDPDRGAEIRTRVQEIHSLRPGFHAYAAVEPPENVIGMIYGYHGSSGQWWHDTVARAISPRSAAEWLADSYELVEVAVEPKHQSEGVGTALIRQLLDGRDEHTCVLSTRTDSDAHYLYQRLGFEVITEMLFAVRGAPFYVMGKRLRTD
ncbi:MAG: GNAT family N-acetyltransferase [Dehalococcoidia bacterium]|nr:GNAT family N-acetyltransferase [Dehalococcoidia bacterium]